MTALIQLNKVTKSYRQGDTSVPVLQGVDLTLDRGESLAVMGPSGSGKSTLLHILGTLDRPDAGAVRIDGTDPFELKEAALAEFRNQVIGFVFQDHHLLPQYTVMENVLLPTRAVAKGPDRRARAEDLLTRVGLAHRLKHLPAQLSGGERQRVAIARALIQEPAVLLCDEPTGNLDAETAETVVDVLLKLHREVQSALVVVTHGEATAARCARRAVLSAGMLRTDAASQRV